MRLRTFLVTASLAAAGVLFFEQDNIDFNAARTCDIPLSVQAGRFDSRFRMTERTFHRALDEAISLWQGATDRQLFRQTDSAGLAVNMIYDSRQARASETRTAKTRIEQEEAAIDRQKRALDQQREALDQAQRQFKRDQERLNSKTDELNRLIERWNHGNLAQTPSNRRMLERRQAELESERKELQQQQEQISRRIARWRAAVDDFNARVTELRDTTQAFNADVSKRRITTMGEYQQQGSERTIEIYQATTYQELRLVIAHELGHALGIGHVPDSASVMNAAISPENLDAWQLSPEDLAALRKTCEL